MWQAWDEIVIQIASCSLPSMNSSEQSSNWRESKSDEMNQCVNCDKVVQQNDMGWRTRMQVAGCEMTLVSDGTPSNPWQCGGSWSFRKWPFSKSSTKVGSDEERKLLEISSLWRNVSTLLDRLTLRCKSQTVFPITSERHDAKHETFENLFKRLVRGNSLGLVLRKLGSIVL